MTPKRWESYPELLNLSKLKIRVNQKFLFALGNVVET